MLNIMRCKYKRISETNKFLMRIKRKKKVISSLSSLPLA